MRRFIPLLFGFFLLLLCIGISLGRSSFRAPSREIEQRLLDHVSLGATPQAVRQHAMNEGWEVTDDRYFTDRRDDDGNYPYVSGYRLMVISMGHYYTPLRTDVESYWGFNETDHLEDVAVRKTADGP